MNYIAHLTGFFQRVSRDYRLNPTHVSLYMALFLQWNLCRFRNPLSVSRAELMEISRISSRVTYHRCIKELHAWGYLHYDPSYNHFRGSLVYMLGFDERQDRECTPEQANLCTGAVPVVDSGCTGAERELGPSINSINNKNFLKSLNKREAPMLAAGSENEQEGAPGVQLFDAAVVGDPGADAGNLHHLGAGNRDGVAEPAQVPLLEQGHVQAHVRGVEAVIP